MHNYETQRIADLESELPGMDKDIAELEQHLRFNIVETR